MTEAEEITGIPPERFELIQQSVSEGDFAAACGNFTDLHPADRAEVLLRLEPEFRTQLFQACSQDSQTEILELLPEDVSADLVSSLSVPRLVEVLDELSPNVAADILGELEPEQADPALEQMEDAESIRPLLDHEEDTAGGIMTPEFVALRESMSVRAAVDFLRSNKSALEQSENIYVVDDQNRLRGLLDLRNLIIASPDMELGAIMLADIFHVTPQTDQEEAVRKMRKYRLWSLPVVDEHGTLTGVITHDEMVNVIDEEASEDLLRLANISDSYVKTWSPLRVMIRTRLPWLLVNLGTAFLAANIVNLFEATISKLAVLATLQGIVAGQGGNAATQSLAIMVRGIALNEVQFRDAWRMIRRELLVALVNGLVVGVSVGFLVWAWKGNPILGLIIGLAMVGNMLAAAVAGTFVPLALKALGLDPALASAVVVTTVTDCVGFFIFLGLAATALHLM